MIRCIWNNTMRLSRSTFPTVKLALKLELKGTILREGCSLVSQNKQGRDAEEKKETNES